MERPRYLRQFFSKTTDKLNPLQEQVLNPEDLFMFMKDLEKESIQKVMVILFDANNYSLGNSIVSIGEEAANVRRKSLYRPVVNHEAPRFVILTNHPDGDPNPTDSDLELLREVHLHSKTLLESEMIDYVVVGSKKYWAMSIQDSTANTKRDEADIPDGKTSSAPVDATDLD